MAKAVPDRIQNNDSDIRELAPGTYLSARKPLATLSIAIAASLLYAGITHDRAVAAPDVSTPKKVVQAFVAALERNDMALAHSFVIGTAEQVFVAKREHDLDAASSRLEIAKARKFEGEERAKEEADKSRSRWANANEQIEKDSARVSSGWFGRVFVLLREGPGWKIDLSRSSDGLGADLVHQAGQSVLTVLNEVTERIEKGYYKNKDEVDHDLRAKLAPLIAATEPQPSPAPSPITTPQVAPESTSLAAEALPTYPAREAKKHIGEMATVTGTVACITRAADWQLYFDDCAIRTAFYAKLRENASGPALDVNKLKGVAIAVTGKIVGPTDRPWIVVETTSQIVKQREPTREELDAAIARTNKAVEANHYDPNAHYQRGLAKEKRAALDSSPEGYRAAMTDYNQVLKLDSSHADALVHIGDCYAALQEYDAAKRAWDKAIEVSPKAKALLATSIEKEKARYCYAAISALDELIEMEPKNAALYYRRANLYLMDHANQTANADFQRASELEPTNLAYGLKASRPLAPSKRPPTADEIMNRVIGGGLTVLGAAITATALSDIAKAKARNEQLERVKRLIEGSGGRKVECPKCNGLGNTSYSMDSFTSHDQNPHILGSSEYNRFEEERRTEHVVKCNQCDGVGVIDK